ncbi:MAG: exlusion protein FxsA [Zetaproteobacteria bacterium CG12_big_fil_rev_8_21_14_0_65_55_1124]|nr:MAG: exlusion protein FxsA [Zetaproteobacteria bacterium CG1_02_55_237]PIS19162.1 MAG: exlusion protein FxsA [Zetaproteobacteria bacterium CG08_land_8_20_14_0_20_55_17]PIW43858.1 MAG: exlusion protein FxsA [Zetaproteobacteria bacterium CG12_big_fil_rev_8_21_14_0_65_55_1124]PIY53003.1 MAG: exlusion protein FxsA [Zetaproteobacteria bacterium CG_4_10_14_0_8_um_filter_55_43]PIZ37637.1 MAG: exlusion protein FxsA [Zetaproteobacteria bacterium CG_4_10_14_0_2_um_filter_55_20]PJB79688.1 MAG: exlusio
MLRILFALFIFVPLLELYVLIEVGSGIGGMSTIALCLLTAALGGFLIRWQGMSTLIDAQKRIAHGEIPAEHGFHGLMIALAGLLLFLPGFVSDTVGFLLLVPPLRGFIIRKLLPIQQIAGKRQSDIIDAEIIMEDKHIR